MRQYAFPRSGLWRLILLPFLPGVAVGDVNVLTYHNNNSRTGANLDETILTPANVNRNVFGKLFNYAVDGHIYAQPLYVSGVNLPGRGTRNVVFVATQHNSVYAFDADSNAGTDGGLLWHVNMGPSAATPNPDFGNRFGGFTEIVPEVGITGTPVIDLTSSTLYLDAFTHEGTNYFHKIHALSLADGSERPSSPVLVRATCPGAGIGSVRGVVTFDPKQQLQRSALTLAGGVLYVAYASYAITDPYHGWVLGFNPQSLARLPGYVFNTTPNSTVAEFGPHAGEGGIWMGGGGLCAEGNNLYFASGNGYFDAFPGSGRNDYGDSLIKLSTVGGLSVADFFTPFNHRYMADNDLDLGSGGVTLLDQGGSSTRLMVCAGKPGWLYVVNRDQMTSDNTHVNGSADLVAQSFLLPGGSCSTPAWFNNQLYLAPSGKQLVAFSLLDTGLFDTNFRSAGSRTFRFPGATPSISADGSRNGIVWAVSRDSSAVLTASDSTDLTQEIYSSDSARDQLPEGVKFAVPTVANGKVYVGTKGGLFVFGLLNPGGGGGGPANVPAGCYNGLFMESDWPRLGRSGLFTATVTSRRTFTGLLWMSGKRFPFAGKFDTSGNATSTIARTGQAPLTMALQMDPSGSRDISGTVSGDGWSADVNVHHVLPARTAPLAGRYTLILPGPANSDPQMPQGDGYATAFATSTGIITVSGLLADGTKLTQSIRFSQDGVWPLYMYVGGKQIIGFLNLNAIKQGGGGQLTWSKSASSSRFYPNGFSLQINVLGSEFESPASSIPILSFSDGTITLTGGNLSSDLAGPVTIGRSNTITGGSGLKATINRKSGLFSGSLVNPDTRRRINFNGAVLQNQDMGSGFFLGTNQSGRATLESR